MEASGPGSLTIAGDVRDSLLVLGNDNVLEVALGDDALLRQFIDATRLEVRRRSSPRTPCPRPFPDHLDREPEVAAVRRQPAHVNLTGRQGIGKTYVLLVTLADAEPARDGTVYLDADGRDADDLLVAMWREFHDCDERVVVGPERLRRDLAAIRATVAIDGAGPEAGDTQRLLIAAPEARFVVASRRRMMPQASRVRIDGLPLEAVEALVEAETGAPLGEDERRAVARLVELVDGHPVLVRQAASLADETGATLGDVAASLVCEDPVAELSERLQASLEEPDRELLRELAAGGAPIGTAVLERAAGADAAQRLTALESRHVVESHSPRYSLTGALATTPPHVDEPDIERTAGVLADWAETARPADVAEEFTPILAAMRWVRRHGPARLVIRLGRAVDHPLALRGRWAGWLEALMLVRDAAADGVDPAAHAWALHQLGTRAYALGDPDTAIELLEQALGERRRLADPDGEAATAHNLEFIYGGGPPPDTDQQPQPDGPRFPGARALVAGLAAVALVGGGAVLAFGGGAADQEETAQGSPPRIEIATPARGGRYAPGSVVRASFRCLEATTGQVIRGAGCRGTRAPNARIDTAPGGHTFRVTATGDDGLTKSVRVVYLATSENRDRRRPTITVTTPQSRRYTPGQPVIAAYSCDDHGGSGIAECRGTRPDGRRVSTRIGRHRFIVRAVDRDGNTALRQLLYYVPDPDHPDTQDPTIAITRPAATQYDEGAAITAGFTCSDDRGTPSCSATIAASAGDTIPVRDGDTLPNAPDTYTLTVTAVDDAGNDAAVPRSYTVTSGPGTSQPACADKKDNDGDTRVDRKDPGCSSAEDNDETDLTIDDCATAGETTCANEPTTVLALPQDGPLVAPSVTPTPESTG